MRHFDQHWLLEGVARQMWREALTGTWDGKIRTATAYSLEMRKPYFERCKALHVSTGTMLIFTRDEGMHSSGWWKNPEFERCYHLSVSFKDALTMATAPRDIRLSKEWVEAFFHEDKRLIWAEPPYSSEGKSAEVWHYRVFCDLTWTPILPRKEVYSRDFTEIGWLSFSELNFDPHPALENVR